MPVRTKSTATLMKAASVVTLLQQILESEVEVGDVKSVMKDTTAVKTEIQEVMKTSTAMVCAAVGIPGGA